MKLDEYIGAFEVEPNTVILPTLPGIREQIELVLKEHEGMSMKNDGWKEKFSEAIGYLDGIMLFSYEHQDWKIGASIDLWLELEEINGEIAPAFRMVAVRRSNGDFSSEANHTVWDILDGRVSGEQILSDFMRFAHETLTSTGFIDLLNMEEHRAIAGCYW